MDAFRGVNMEDRFEYLIEVTYQRNRKPFEYEIIDWKRYGNMRKLQDERDTE